MKKPSLNPSRKELRNFGLVILIGFGIIGALLFHKGKIPIAKILWGASTAVLVISLILPALARYLYIGWMYLGLGIGFIMSRVVMTIIFFGVLTPVACFFRLKNRDSLHLKKPLGPTFWNEHPKTEKSDYEHLF